MAKIINSPSKYIQGRNEIANLATYYKLRGNSGAYLLVDKFIFDNFKNKIRNFLEHLNDEQGFKLPQEDELTSYDNPEYLWLAYELEHIRHTYNSVMVNPCTGELLAGCKKIPYVQLRLKLEAFQ